MARAFYETRTSEPMPEFDAVTGVSTGGLIAPYAFVGTAKALDDISRLYTQSVNELKPRLDLLFLLKRTGGLLDRGKLEQTVTKVINSDLSAELREGFAKDRLLLTETTNLNSGLGHIWNIQQELTPGEAGLARYRSILIASTAIPGAFAPVMIDGDPHVDGGVASNTLLGADLADFQRLAAALRKSGVRRDVRIRLWVLVNKPVYPAVQKINHRSVEAVYNRGTRLLFSLKELMTLTRYWELSQAVTTGVPGLTMEMRFIGVPQELTGEVSLSRMVDPALMRRLDQCGFERARGNSRWDTLPVSAYARPAAETARSR